MKIGTKIQNYRKLIGLSQEELAHKVGVSRQTVSKWERDECLPEIDKIVVLCNLFNISTDELLGVEMDSKSSKEVAEPSKTRQNFKITKTGKIVFIIGIALCLLSIVLTEIWALMDSARSGSWYTNKLLYLIKSPLAVIFFSAIVTAIIGLAVILKNKNYDRKTETSNKKIILRLGFTFIGSGSVSLALIWLLSINTGIFMLPIKGPTNSYSDISGLFYPIALLLLLVGVILLITGYIIKKPDYSAFSHTLKIGKTITISGLILFVISILLYPIMSIFSEGLNMASVTILRILRPLSIYCILAGFITLFTGFIKKRRHNV